jgi:hypothetical protein
MVKRWLAMRVHCLAPQAERKRRPFFQNLVNETGFL